MISAFHYENDPDSDMEASMLDQYTAFEMLTPTEKFKKYVERKIEFKFERFFVRNFENFFALITVHTP